MATVTAHALVGTADAHHGGVLPSHQLLLWENDWPLYMLIPVPMTEGQVIVRWVPTLEHMLEDGLLLLAIHVLGSPALLELAGMSEARGRAGKTLEVYDRWDKATHAELLAACRKLDGFPKLVLTLLQGCFLNKQIDVLKDYRMDVEICCPVYARDSSAWVGGARISDFIEHFRATLE